MKYRDYLIVPVLVMYLLFASCAYVAGGRTAGGAPERAEEPVASINPEDISWNNEYWYASGARGTECFCITESDGISFVTGHETGDSSAYVISNMHLRCSRDGRAYDLIFPDALTAYDLNSGTYYQRADYSLMVESIVSGRFVNTENPRDIFTFRDNGKSVENFGDKVFKGTWELETANCLAVYDKTCKSTFYFSIIFDSGSISGIECNGISYKLVA